MSDSENVETVETVEVPLTKKDPKKVEQGKRLAMISKEAKERKMRARLKEEQENSWSSKLPIYVAVGTSCGFLLMTILYWRKQPKFVHEKVVVEEPKKEKRKFVSNKNFEEL